MFIDLENGNELNISSQYFSGTDKSTNANEPGVVFPLACNDSVKNMLNVSSIIDHHHNHHANVLCKYTEARIADADTENKVVDYKETKVLSLEYDLTDFPLDNLLEINHKLVYQCDNKVTLLLKEKLISVLNALYSNENPFDAIMVIDKSNIEEKHYSDNTLWNLKDDLNIITTKQCQLTKESYEVIDKFVFAYDSFIKDLVSRGKKKEIRDSIDLALKVYYSTFDCSKMFCAKFWGKEIQNMKNDKKYRNLFKDNLFMTQLANELIIIVQTYDIDLSARGE